jgi:hypothetical protein
MYNTPPPFILLPSFLIHYYINLMYFSDFNFFLMSMMTVTIQFRAELLTQIIDTASCLTKMW